MDPTSAAPIAAAAAVTGAGLQLVLSGWRDLGALSVGAAAIAVVLGVDAPSARPIVAAGVALAAVLAAIAWARGAGAGVGRPALAGIVLAVAVVAGLTPWAFGPVPAATLAAPIGAATLLCAGIALERKGVRRVRPMWYRTVPVER